MSLPPMPKLPRSGGKSGKRTRAAKIPTDLSREVQWKEGKEEEGEFEHVYGTCAKCGRRRQALDLTWRPDRMLFGELHLGFWACEYGCEEEEEDE